MGILDFLFAEDEHPRAPKGSAGGGKFVAAKAGGGGSGGGGGGGKGSGGAGKTNTGTLAFDPKTGHGTGYGVHGGDPRVRALQQALTRLHVTDDAGKPLAADGQLGPKTSAAVKKLQAKLGLPADGAVTPALLRRIVEAAGRAPGASATSNAVPDKKPATTKPRAPAPTNPVAPKPSADTPLKKPGSRYTARGITVAPHVYDRSFPLDDIQISRSGDGRTVEAYAAMFGTPYEVRDQHGHYLEIVDRAAFNRTLKGGGRNAMCLYNHGFTVHGTPSEMGSVPLGTPLEIRADTRGLLTVTRYNKGPFADQVLEAIRNGDIRAQSFRGRIVRSDPSGKVPRTRPGMTLPTVTRHELGLTDYGPTPMPVNQNAEIVAVRSMQELLEDLQELDADERFELLRTFGVDLPEHTDLAGDDDGHDEHDQAAEVDEPVVDDAAEPPATPDGSGPGAEDPPSTALRSAQEFRRRLRVAMLTRGM